MTTEEAIRILDPETSHDALLKYADLPAGALMEIVEEANLIAVSALRAQQAPAKLDRERWEGCGLCKKASLISGSAFVHYDHEEVAYDGLTFSYMKYCPCCGRPLTEEALAEMERRIGGNDGAAD